MIADFGGNYDFLRQSRLVAKALQLCSKWTLCCGAWLPWPRRRVCGTSDSPDTPCE